MNHYQMERFSRDYVSEAHQWADRERLVREAKEGHERPAPLTARIARWIGGAMIAAGTILETRAECWASPASR